MINTGYAQHMILYVLLNNKKVKIIVDSGATENYISREYVLRNKTPIRDKKNPYRLTLADGSPVRKERGQIKTETTPLLLRIEEHYEEIVLDVLGIKYDVILGKAWLSHHNPTINWKTHVLEFQDCDCAETQESVYFIKAV